MNTTQKNVKGNKDAWGMGLNITENGQAGIYYYSESDDPNLFYPNPKHSSKAELSAWKNAKKQANKGLSAERTKEKEEEANKLWQIFDEEGMKKRWSKAQPEEDRMIELWNENCPIGTLVTIEIDNVVSITSTTSVAFYRLEEEYPYEGLRRAMVKVENMVDSVHLSCTYLIIKLN